jgi:hypothetical protein
MVQHGWPRLLQYFWFFAMNINPEILMLIKEVLEPELEFYEGLPYLKFLELDEKEIAKPSKMTNVKEIHKSWNRIILYDLFGDFDGIDEKVYLEIGNWMERSWNNHFQSNYPELNITVEVDNSPQNYGVSVSFYQDNI